MTATLTDYRGKTVTDSQVKQDFMTAMNYGLSLYGGNATGGKSPTATELSASSSEWVLYSIGHKFTLKGSFDYASAAKIKASKLTSITIETGYGSSFTPAYTATGFEVTISKLMISGFVYSANDLVTKFDSAFGSTADVRLSSEVGSTDSTGSDSTANAGLILATPTALSYTDTSADDTFSKSEGTLAASGGAKLTYALEGEKSGSKTGTYGTFKLDSKTGMYSYTPDDKAVEALSDSAAESFILTVSDGTNSATATLTINLAGAVDVRTGTANNDRLTGTEGKDSLSGGAGGDAITGGAGDDTINGGAGKDVLTGSSGNDTFVFDSLFATDADSIKDFTAGDRLAFDVAIFAQLNGANTTNFFAGTKADGSDDYLIFDKKSGKLYYDVDGSGSTAQILIATVKGSGAQNLGFDAFDFV